MSRKPNKKKRLSEKEQVKAKFFWGAFATSRSAHVIAAVFALLPLVLSICFVIKYGVDVPVMDEYDGFIKPIGKLFSENLTFMDLFRLHNEHSNFLPKIAAIVLGVVSDYNVYVLMLFSQLMMAVILGAVFLGYRRLKKSYFLFIPVPFMVLSFAQIQNFLWGFQIGFIMTLMFSVMSLLFFSLHIERTSTGGGGVALPFSYLCGFLISF